MAFIFVMSTQLGAGENTSRILGPLLNWLFPGIAPETISGLRFVVRKFAHVTEYAVLFLLCFRALKLTRPGSFPVMAIPALLIAVTYAATDEWHQTFVPSRAGAISDVMIDACGALCAMAGTLVYHRSKRS